MCNIEEWKPYHENPLYLVSSLGRVRRVDGSILAYPKCGRYAHITLTKPRMTKYIHRMVLETFVGRSPHGYHASHINGDPRDNRLANLIWESPQSNMARKVGHGTEPHGEQRWSSKITYLEAVTIKVSPMPGSALAARFGISQTEVDRIKRGVTWCEIPSMEILIKDTLDGKALTKGAK